MAYKANAPADDEFLADFPAEQREQHRAIVNDKIVNAGKLNGLTSGNASGNIPVSNGTKCANLNADLLDGHDSTYFATSGHTHDAATQSSNGLMSNTDKKKIDGIATGAEVNQNAFANVKVGSTTIQADAKQDTLTFAAGDNIELTPDATNDKVTVSATGLLPLSGGTMTGTVYFSQDYPSIRSTKTTTRPAFFSGTGDNTGGALYVYGKDYNSTAAGSFNLTANDGTNNKALIGKPDGTLTWAGTAISLNGHTHSYLPLSGGTITGSIAKKTNLTKGTKPSSTSWLISNIIYDTAGTATANRMSEYRAFVDANGKTGTEIISYDFTSGATSNALLGVYKDLDGAAHVNTNGQLVINRNNGSVGGGIKLTGAGQNFAISAQNTNATKGTAPSSTQYWGIDFYGKDMAGYGNRIGILETSLDANNLCSTYIRAYNCTTNANTANASIGVHVNSSGTAYTSAPTPADSDDSTKIATTAWVRNVAALASHTHSYLPLSGGTLNGNLLISKTDPNITLDKNNMTRATAPSAAVNKVDIHARDSADKSVWGIYSRYGTDKSNRVDLIAYKGTTTDNTWTGIGVGYDASGNWLTYAPTPASTDNSTKIATTAFVRNFVGAGGGITTSSIGANGYVKFANGLIIQWGYYAATTAMYELTFPIAFSVDCYFVGAIMLNPTADSNYAVIKSKTKTGATINNYTYENLWMAIGR